MLYIVKRCFREKKRLLALQSSEGGEVVESTYEIPEPKSTTLLICNWIISLLAILALVFQWFPTSAVFLVFFPIALWVNFPKPSMQAEQIVKQAAAAIPTTVIIFCAGVFSGILKESGMIEAMTLTLTQMVPTAMTAAFIPIVGIISVPMGIFIDVDSMYYGVLPVLNGLGESLGIPAVAVSRAMMLSTISTSVLPLVGSTWVLMGVTGLDLGEHQKKTFLWIVFVDIIMLCVAKLVGAI